MPILNALYPLIVSVDGMATDTGRAMHACITLSTWFVRLAPIPRNGVDAGQAHWLTMGGGAAQT